MNNKKFRNALLFSAALLSTGMISSCDDYDDDIDKLNGRVDAVETSIANLQKQIQEGKWVKSFQRNSTNNGYVLTLSDNSTLEIKDGEKGANGQNGAAGKNGTTWEIDPVTKHWIEIDPDGNRTDKNIVAEGKNGVDGKSPYIENNRWMVWNAEEKKFVDAGPAMGYGSFVVDYDNYWELNLILPNAEGEISKDTKKVILPKTAEISSLEVYSLGEDGKSLNDPQITLKMGKVQGSQPVTFNGTTYQPGQTLVSKTTTLVAQVNPLKADASLYTFNLVNTKGESKYKVSAATQNMSEAPLTRAEATENPGLWNLTLEVPAGVIIEDNDNKAVYSLQTASITNAETVIASRFNVTIDVEQESGTSPLWKYVSVYETDQLSWEDLLKEAVMNFEKWEVADYYLEIPKNMTAQAERDGVSIDKAGKTITFNKAIANSINYVEVHYLNLKGQHVTNKLSIEVENTEDIALAKDFEWQIDGTTKTITVDVVGRDALDEFATSGVVVTDVEYKFKNEQVYVDDMPVSLPAAALNDILGGVTFNKSTDPYGYNKWTASMTFDGTKVFAEPYEAVVTLKNNQNEIRTIKFNINLTAPKAYTFVREAAFFDGNAAKVYAMSNGTSSAYNLQTLYKFGSNDTRYITFSDGGNSGWITNATERGGAINVPNADINKVRNITVTYSPFNNPNLNKSFDKITVEFRSEIFDGEIKYTGKALSVSNGIDAEFDLSSFSFKDFKDKTYKVAGSDKDARVTSYSVKLVGENSNKYLKLTNNNDKYTLSRKDDTVIVNPQDCKVKLSVVDIWGQTKVVEFTVQAK